MARREVEAPRCAACGLGPDTENRKTTTSGMADFCPKCGVYVGQECAVREVSDAKRPSGRCPSCRRRLRRDMPVFGAYVAGILPVIFALFLGSVLGGRYFEQESRNAIPATPILEVADHTAKVKIEGVVASPGVVMWSKGRVHGCGPHWYATEFVVADPTSSIRISPTYLNDSSCAHRVIASSRPNGSYQSGDAVSLVGYVKANGTSAWFEALHAAPGASRFFEEDVLVGASLFKAGLAMLPLPAVPVLVLFDRRRSHRLRWQSFNAALKGNPGSRLS